MSIRQWIFILGLSGLSVCAGCQSPDATPGATIVNSVPETTKAPDGRTMVYVSGGTFLLSGQDDSWEGAHEVTLSGYWIDQTEVTNDDFLRCVEAGVCRAPTTCAWGDPTFGDASYADHPVICVTWRMARTYCEWAGGRLPTETEWDYAARGDERFIYPWGNQFDASRLNFCDASCPNADSQIRYDDDGYPTTAPVGSFPEGASWCGALDMAGNVWEWVEDWYPPSGTDARQNPNGPAHYNEKIIRGGSWYDTPEFIRLDLRHPYNPNDYNHLVGFRCVIPETGEGSQ